MAAPFTPSYVGHYSRETAQIPGVFNGMRMEVLDQNNELLFVADAEIMSEKRLELVRTSELLQPVPQNDLPVSVRGFNAAQNRVIHMEGVLSKLARNQDRAWIVNDLVLKSSDAGRSFSRRPIQAQAWVQPLDAPEAQWLACSVVNASAGGVCFRSTEPLESGAKMRIRFRLRRDREQPPLTIAIRRVTDRKENFEYGCEFVDLSPEVDTIIIRTIIQLQIMQDSAPKNR